MKSTRAFASAVLAVAFAAWPPAVPAREAPQATKPLRDVPYVPSPPEVVQRMIDLRAG